MKTVLRSRWTRVGMALVALGAVGGGWAALAQDARVVRDKGLKASVATARGLLEVSRLNFEDGGHTNQIALDGRVIQEEPDYESLSIVASYPEKGPVRLLLLALNTGGNGCPALYKVLEVQDDGHLTQSEEFGNCSPLAKPSYSRGVLGITLPRMGGAAEQSWRYADGRLTKQTASSRSRKRKP